MFGRCSTVREKTVFKPTPLHHPRKLVVNKVILGERASSSAAAQSSFVKQANKARDTIFTALASIKNLLLTMTVKVFPPRTGKNIPRA